MPLAGWERKTVVGQRGLEAREPKELHIPLQRETRENLSPDDCRKRGALSRAVFSEADGIVEPSTTIDACD